MDLKNYDIFLDLDGTILDVSERHKRVYLACVKELGGKPIPKNIAFSLKRAEIPEYVIGEISGCEPKAYTKLRLKYLEAEKYLIYDELFSFSHEILSKLRKRNRLFLVTLRKSRKDLMEHLNRFNLPEYFFRISNYYDNTEKPWTIKTRLIVRSHSISPKTVIIGDSEADILAGKNLGIKTIAVASGIRNEFCLKKYKPDLLIKNLSYLK